MQFNAITVLAALFVLGVAATPAPVASISLTNPAGQAVDVTIAGGDDETSENPLFKRGLDCKGSTLCKYLSQGDCDNARRQINKDNTYTTNGSKGGTGVCQGHCGLFVGGGGNCDLTGQEMIDAFNELRRNNCQKCGKKTYPDGCEFKMDYVNGC